MRAASQWGLIEKEGAKVEQKDVFMAWILRFCVGHYQGGLCKNYKRLP